MTKLIGFTGAGGTGKTTIARMIGNNVPSYVSDLRAVVFGEYSAYGDLFGQTFTDFQDLIKHAQILLENTKMRADDDDQVIAPVERSLIDYAAYALHQEDIEPCFSLYFKDWLEDYVDDCINLANTRYGGIVYFPINKFPLNFRGRENKENDADSIIKTDEYIQELLKRIKIPVLWLKSVDPEERIKEILNYF